MFQNGLVDYIESHLEYQMIFSSLVAISGIQKNKMLILKKNIVFYAEQLRRWYRSKSLYQII